MKKKVIVFTCSDEKNEVYARLLEKSFKYFHKDIPFHCIKGEELQEYLKVDRQFFYRQKPIIAEKFIGEYECVIGLDADQLILGDLSYIWNTKDYDVATVMNYNRIDPLTYGYVQAQGINPVEYMNCGLVAMRSEAFIKNWKAVCLSPQFDRLQYKEQDILNFLIYYGNYNCRCLDHGDKIAGMVAWWGLVAKGELLKAVVKDGKIIIPKAEDKYPIDDTELKVWHVAGGNQPNKMTYKIAFTDEVSDYIDKILK